ncbi:MAG TPA: alpha/beta fold hydrolase [Candidatus Binatia bacterium]|nr:alpha/beta fold hydrolase [Candidatus Binatia bacterium]
MDSITEDVIIPRFGRLHQSLFACLLISIFFSVVHSGETLSISRELHWAVTAEKFELALERQRAGKKAQRRFPVVLSHGLFVNSVFLNLDEEHSLAEYLARQGFDVWNLSLRGSGRSLAPLRGGPAVWSIDEMIDQDLPAVVHYIQEETRSPRLFWAGYELGGMLLYGYSIRSGGMGLAGAVTIAAPATFTHPQQQVLKKLLPLADRPFLKSLFLYLNGPLLGRLLIPLAPRIERIFYNPENMDDEIKSKLLEQALLEIKPGVLDQLLLMIARGELVSGSGDYSYRKNLRKLRLPVMFVGGAADPLAPPDSIEEVYRAVGSVDRSLRIFGRGSKHSTPYGHLDLLAGKKAREEVYPAIGNWLKQRDGRG